MKPKQCLIFFASVALVLAHLGFGKGELFAAVKGAPKPEVSTGEVIQAKGQVHAPKGTPTYEIQEIERKMEEYNTSKNLTPEQRANNQRIKREILNGAFDLRELSRLALDKHWNQISPEEQNNFVNLMTDLLETKAIFSKEQSKTKGKSYTITYQGDKYLDGKSKAKALTQIYVPGENVSLAIVYSLKKEASGRWKIFDVVVDDASLVDNYRYQFDTIISKNGYSELVRRMKKKLTEMQEQQS